MHPVQHRDVLPDRDLARLPASGRRTTAGLMCRLTRCLSACVLVHPAEVLIASAPPASSESPSEPAWASPSGDSGGAGSRMEHLLAALASIATPAFDAWFDAWFDARYVAGKGG